MNRRRLLFAGLRHYWRTHLGTVAGMAVATATLVGAMIVGDSVRFSLQQGANARVGAVNTALSSGDRYFRDSLADAVGQGSAPVVLLSGVASTSDGGARVHGVNVHGVDGRFFALRPDLERGVPSLAAPEPEGAYVNVTLAAELGLDVGDTIVVRVAKPSALPRDVSLSSSDITLALRVKVERVLGPDSFGNFGLLGGSLPKPNLFVDLAWLQGRAEVLGRANLLLSAEPDPDVAADLLRSAWNHEDAQLVLRELGDGRRELRSERIFFDPPVLDLLSSKGSELEGIFTYFVNSLTLGERYTPYSMVTGIGPLGTIESHSSVFGQPLSAGEILLNAWEAEDLEAKVGDEVRLSFHVIDASRQLVEREESFTVAGILPLEGVVADRSLMPDFPGLADADNCRDWEPGTPVELERIRDKDEVYWDAYGGTPKGFVTLASAREIWRNRFGELTAVRFPASMEAAILESLRTELDPAALGLFFQDVRAGADAAGNSPTDFGGLFLGLSSFLILAALLLAGQLFAFGVQQRFREAGLLAALGFEGSAIRGMFLREAAALGAIGALLGVGFGMLYTKLVLAGLAGLWRDAVASARIEFHAEPATLVIGAVAALLASMLTAWLVIRRALKAPSHALLSSAAAVEALEQDSVVVRRGRQRLIIGLCLVVAVALVLLVDPSAGPSAAGAFFGAGALALTGLLLACRLWLRGAAVAERGPAASLTALAVANTYRRPGRSLTLITLMAIGTFLVVAVGANRLGPVADEGARDSGTGGFLFFGRTSLPVVADLNTELGREGFALSEDVLSEVNFVPARVRAGDDASCLNLARPSTPQLLGLRSEDLTSRGAFRFASTSKDTEEPWSLLDDELEGGAIPAIGDAISLTWQLKKGLGDRIDYVDERGRKFQVEIVGTVADTILQGMLVISEEYFQDLYPSEGGHRVLLVDGPGERLDEIGMALTRGLEDLGLSLERTGARLDAFHAVQNTYLSVFQMLGGLGLLLGSVGLAVVLLRNTFERRSELALCGALGFRDARIRWWVAAEYGVLLLVGLGVGLASSMVAVMPAMRAPGSDLSLTNMFVLGIVLAVAGGLWILLAARVAVERAPLTALGAE